MPKENINRENGIIFERWIADRRFLVFFSLNNGRLEKSSAVREKISAGSDTKPASINAYNTFSPSPPISKGCFPTKWMKYSRSCAKQFLFVHRVIASPERRATGVLHMGQFFGK